jgi:hypothetical protein
VVFRNKTVSDAFKKIGFRSPGKWREKHEQMSNNLSQFVGEILTSCSNVTHFPQKKNAGLSK